MNETVTMNVQDVYTGVYSIGYATDLHRVPLTEHRIFVMWLSKPTSTINTFLGGGKKEREKRGRAGRSCTVCYSGGMIQLPFSSSSISTSLLPYPPTQSPAFVTYATMQSFSTQPCISVIEHQKENSYGSRLVDMLELEKGS